MWQAEARTMPFRESALLRCSTQKLPRQKKAEELSCSLAETFAAELSSDEPDFSCETSVEEGVSADVISDEDATQRSTVLRTECRREI